MIDMNYYQNLPKKRMGAGMILLDQAGQILIVKPHYKDHWILPGGVVEADESPQQACVREVEEEIGLSIPNPSFLGVHYLADLDGRGENLQFVFYGGQLDNDEIKSIRRQEDEHEEIKFVPIEDGKKLLSDQSAFRVSECLKALEKNTAVYLEWLEQGQKG